MINLYYDPKSDKIALIPDGGHYKFIEERLSDFVEKVGYNHYVTDFSNVMRLRYATRPVSASIRQDASFSKKLTEFDKTSSMLYIIVSETKAIFDGRITAVPGEAIDKATSYFDKGAKNNPKYKNGSWDGFHHLYDARRRMFPSGLLFIIEEVLKARSIPYEVIYTYEREIERMFDWEICDNIVPDDDQIVAVSAALKAKRCVVKAPTGFGKTAILAKRLTAGFGVPTLFLANRKSLLDDAQHEFMTGISGLSSVGKIMDGEFDGVNIEKTPPKDIEITSPVIVATIQSISERLADPRTKEAVKKFLSETCKFIMVDETQAVGTPSWDLVLSMSKAPYHVFLSATPKRSDGGTLRIHAYSGDIAFYTTAEAQIAKGRLSEVRIEFCSYDHQLFNENDKGLEYHEAYQAFITQNDNRNTLAVSKAIEMLAEGRHVLILFTFIEHGELLRDKCVEMGIPIEDIRFIYGETKDAIRKQAIAEFRKGDFKVLIGSTIFDAGVNIPIISGIVLAGAGNSEITQVQRIGRGVRNADYEDLIGYIPDFMKEADKKVCRVVDIFDRNVKFFERQGFNRYNTTKDEFGKSRVKMTGDTEKAKASKVDRKLVKEMGEEGLKDFESQLEGLRHLFPEGVDHQKETVLPGNVADFIKQMK